MPTTTSAKKRVRQNAKRNALDQPLAQAPDQGSDQELPEGGSGSGHQDGRRESSTARPAVILDKVACTSTIHRNTAARRKSRLWPGVFSALKATQRVAHAPPPAPPRGPRRSERQVPACPPTGPPDPDAGACSLTYAERLLLVDRKQPPCQILVVPAAPDRGLRGWAWRCCCAPSEGVLTNKAHETLLRFFDGVRSWGQRRAACSWVAPPSWWCCFVWHLLNA